MTDHETGTVREDPASVRLSAGPGGASDGSPAWVALDPSTGEAVFYPGIAARRGVCLFSVSYDEGTQELVIRW